MASTLGVQHGIKSKPPPPPAPWTPSTWRTKPISQQITYPSQTTLDTALTRLSTLPPLVTPAEIHSLRRSLALVSRRQSFLLQGGDCAELFSYCTSPVIEAKLKLFLQMSLVLIWGSGKPVVRIARIAGQFAKPRSSPMEKLPDGREVPSFRGDNINGFSPDARTPDPERLVQAYFHSAATLNYIRAALASGIADLHSPMDWDLGHVGDLEIKAKYRRIVESIAESLRFMQTVGADMGNRALETVELFTSHEGLSLEYEEALTRDLRRPLAAGPKPGSPGASASNALSNSGRHKSSTALSTDFGSSPYATSAHFLWIGDRTRAPTHAHIEFFRGITNPIGLKVGPTLPPQELPALLKVLDPYFEDGKVTLITRYGINKIAECLPKHIDAVKESGHRVVWCCDPMHGNTFSTDATPSVKTRSFASILKEVKEAFRIHKEKGTWLGGLHLELTGEAVTECVGGSEGLEEEDLRRRYESHCDPRLNEKQALELAFLVAGELRGDEDDEILGGQ